MTLSQKQRIFTHNQALFVIWCFANGYELTDGESYRPPETAALYAKQGRGIAASLHTMRLAKDWNLFIKGVYQTRSEAYKPLGAFWKSLHKDNRWGGDFTTKDGNHFSMTHGGKQ